MVEIDRSAEMEKEQVEYERKHRKDITLGVLNEKTGKFVSLKSKKGQQLAKQTHKLKGWRNESARHALARKGIKTGKKKKKKFGVFIGKQHIASFLTLKDAKKSVRIIKIVRPKRKIFEKSIEIKKITSD